MVNGISRVYSNQIQQAKVKETSDKKVPARSESRQSVERLLPDLHDKVEISDEGRKAAATGSVTAENNVSKEDVEAIGDNWYGAGYRMAANEAESS
ncbi:MAG: hypothetical protein P9L92_15200 [Candidatus Electryonea clarkiae]|nr:hypothetical protein [Candidatus Electryonea clarkiae]MDP8287527.1 hypothetical protein [Candidatus Electryonea clarkiae]